MRSNFTCRGASLVVLTFLALILAWEKIPRTHSSGETQPGGPARPSPVARSISPPDRHAGRPAAEAAELPAAGRPLDDFLSRAEILSRSTRPTDRGHHVTTLYRTGFKYPLVRVEDDYTDTDPEGHPSRRTAMVADHLLVRIDEGLEGNLDKLLALHPELSIRQRLATGDHVLVRFPDPLSPTAMGEWIETLHLSGLASAEPDYLQSTASVPNDTSYASLWGMHNTGQTGGTAGADIDAQEAWDITTGSSSVIVGIIDSGADYTHIDLAPNIWSNAAGQHGYDYYDQDTDPMDNSPSSHGTHVAGTIGAAGNNSQGVTGVSWQVRMMVLRFIGPTGLGATSDAISCIRFATDNGAKILSNSWGGSAGQPGDNLETEINRARTRGVLFIAAAANGGDDQIGDDNDLLPNYPSNYSPDNIVAVAATDASDQLASFSNYGRNSVDLAAPGVNIYSTLPGNTYGSKSGTSMATPHVAGAAALILAADNTLTYSQVRTRLLGNTDAIPALSQRTVTGGRLNAYKAIRDLGGPVLQLTRKESAITGGNSDSYPNPGESIALNLTLANTGSKVAEGATITAAVSSGAAATLNQTQISAGALAANGAKTFDPAFILTLGSPAASPATFTVTFTLSTPSSAHTWTDSIQLTLWNPATLKGTVTRAGTGNPIQGAAVAIRGPASHDLVTDAAGHYEVSTVAGTFTITASSAGLVSSGPLTVNATPTTPSVNFSLGTAALELTPAVTNLTVPANQTRAVTLSARNSGDSPRDLSFDVGIAGTGLAGNLLYGTRQTSTGDTELVQFDSATGSLLGTRTLPDLSAYGALHDIAHFNQKIWFLCGLFQGGGSVTYRIVPYDPVTNALGTPIALATLGNWPVKLFATDQDLLLTSTSFSGQSSVLKVNTTTGSLSRISTLPLTSTGNVCWSAARKSIFSLNYDLSIQEFLYPGFTAVRNWSLPSATNYSSMVFGNVASALFLSSYQFNGSDFIGIVQKLNPDTGALLPDFNAPQGLSLITAATSGGSSWLTTTLTSSSVSQGDTRSIPLTVDTNGMKTGDQFTATVTLTGTSSATSTTATVNLTVGDAPSDNPDSWSGWFDRYFHRLPISTDATADPDQDGSSNLLEYALGLDPTLPTGNPVTHDFEVIEGQRYLRLTVNRNPTATGITMTVEVSSTLGESAEWTTDGTVVEVNTSAVLQVRDSTPIGSHSHRFIRLKVDPL